MPSKNGNAIITREYRKKYPDVILVDTGDALGDTHDFPKAKAIFDEMINKYKDEEFANLFEDI